MLQKYIDDVGTMTQKLSPAGCREILTKEPDPARVLHDLSEKALTLCSRLLPGLLTCMKVHAGTTAADRIMDAARAWIGINALSQGYEELIALTSQRSDRGRLHFILGCCAASHTRLKKAVELLTDPYLEECLSGTTAFDA